MKYYRYLPLIALLIPSLAFATTVNFTVSGTWTAPAGVTSVDAQVWGDGGGGGEGGSPGGGGGGGGGAYSETTNVSVTPGNVYTVTVGQGAPPKGFSESDGIGSMFLSSTTVFAQGGLGGNDGNSGGNSAGGASASGFGTTKFSGGNGTPGSGFAGGGGGGGGTTGNGGNASFDTAGTGTSVGGGNGGTGVEVNTTGATGSTYGGGGAGSFGGSFKNGGAGARGEVDLTYTAGATQTNATVILHSGTVVMKKGVMVIGN